jgi:hypothetical protein
MPAACQVFGIVALFLLLLILIKLQRLRRDFLAALLINGQLLLLVVCFICLLPAVSLLVACFLLPWACLAE